MHFESQIDEMHIASFPSHLDTIQFWWLVPNMRQMITTLPGDWNYDALLLETVFIILHHCFQVKRRPT